MTRRFPSGSEWRKWDLHIHVPGTKLSDGYDKKAGEPNWDRFAQIIEDSDVSVFGITDYWSADKTIEFIEHYRLQFPNSEKLLLVNIELRLNETVNGEAQMVDFHVIFRDSVDDGKIKDYLSKLRTQITDTRGRQKTCSELVAADYKRATVARPDLRKAFEETFGPKAEPTDYLIYIVPANNNGLRAESGNRRKANLADEIDKVAHAIFGKSEATSAYYLKLDRFEDKNQISKPKPVFGGCDAHDFTQLESWLGKSVASGDTRQVITWVKADPTFEGLQQTLVEPADRVALSELKPDAKDQYKVIRRVRFEGNTDFPGEIAFNPNLNAIIGSRSSGKSALLAHIAYAVAPDYTIRQQVLATKSKESEVGPAAGRSWKSVRATVCKVDWASGSTGGGNIIYIPQNWLYQLSDNPMEVTDKIRPVLESRYPACMREHERLLDAVKSANESIEKAVTRWFELAAEQERLTQEIQQVGDRKSITQARDKITTEIETLHSENSLSSRDLKKFRTVTDEIDANRVRLSEIQIEVEQVAPFVAQGPQGHFASEQGAVGVETNLTPDLEDVPEKLSETLRALIEESDKALIRKVEKAIVDFRSMIASEERTLQQKFEKLNTENAVLLERHRANATLDELVRRQKKQQAALDKLEKLDAKRQAVVADQTAATEKVAREVKSRTDTLDLLTKAFRMEGRTLDQLTFDIAIDYDPDTLQALSEPFSKRASSTYLKRLSGNDPILDIEKVHTNPSLFMEDILTKKQPLNHGHAQVEVAKRILVATPEVRFTADLDEDRIGGFERSTMTPGKQALFALTLILGEAEEQWALLIDQPEDDLDSRSIYGDVVRYLIKQKKQRQIVLVTHNANLVVGADAEEVLVANRHGDDRKNKDSRTFDYLTGSLEYSMANPTSAYELDRMGVREHAVEILDGGEEAFQKRRDKYKL